MAGDLTRAKPIVMDLWQETRLLAPEVRKTYRADALRNMSFLHLSQGSGFTANNMMKLAMEEYDAAESPYSLKQFGRARAYVLRSDIVLRHGKGSADERKQMAIDRLEMANSLFEETVGLYHPESADCQERLKHLKS